jgi:predicted O-methyltransferase YrrM
MKLTLLTTACYRPEAWKLCESYVARQTRQPDQWIVLDDDENPTVCTMGQEYHHWPECRGRGSLTRKITKAVNEKLIKGDAVVILENDDYYAPTYLEMVEKWLETADIVGEGDALYYNVQHRAWFSHHNSQHASFCSTAFKVSLLPQLLKACNTDDPYADYRLWNLVNAPFKKRVMMPVDFPATKRLVVGIKGMPGKLGYGTGHQVKDNQRGVTKDPSFVKLRSLIGKDAEAYENFYLLKPKTEPAMPTPTEAKKPYQYLNPTDVGHGDKWERWLGHLKGTPAIGLEIGTYRGESAEVMLSRVFTHPKSKYICVDPFTGSPEHQLNKIDCSSCEGDTRKRLEKFKNVTIIKDYSEKVLPGFKQELDFIYVDGLHTSQAVMRDAVLGFELLKPGGIMIFDDLHWAAMPNPLDCPKLGIEAFVSAYAKQIQVFGRDSQLGLKKL